MRVHKHFARCDERDLFIYAQKGLYPQKCYTILADLGPLLKTLYYEHRDPDCTHHNQRGDSG